MVFVGRETYKKRWRERGKGSPSYRCRGRGGESKRRRGGEREGERERFTNVNYRFEEDQMIRVARKRHRNSGRGINESLSEVADFSGFESLINEVCNTLVVAS